MIAELRRIAAPIARYADSPDPLVKACNAIALVIASNQPFYPLYLWFAVGDSALPTFLTLVSTPFFLAVPAINRRASLLGRAVPCLFGALNTIICAAVLGVQSGVELFYIPCVMVAAILFRERETWVFLAIAALVTAAYFGLHDRFPVSGLAPEASERLFFINLVSVLGLTVFVGLTHATMINRIEQKAAPSANN